jgi:hypothetical protein
MSKGKQLRPPVEAREPDGYRGLVLAILHRAVQDARGVCHPLCAQPRVTPQAEARDWLADEQAVRELLELAGYDSEPVIQRVQAFLAPAQKGEG